MLSTATTATSRRPAAARPLSPPPERAPRVLLITEGTYPFYWGGVSTWCHTLTSALPEVEFSLLAMVHDPFLAPRFELSENVVEFRPVPLWGLRNAWELGDGISFREVRRRRRSTSEEAVADELLPPFRCFVRQLLDAPRDDAGLAQSIHELHRFFLDHDFDAALRSRAVWDAFGEDVVEGFPAAAARRGYAGVEATLADRTRALQWLYHWLLPLSRPLPPADVAHATMAGTCTLVGAAAKLEHGSAFLLTEHGIYLRESYLAEHATGGLFRKLLKLGFARRMTELAYSLADCISPCCDYNRRWELRIGADAERIRTTYYGVDATLFAPAERPENGSPVVVWAGRIDPLKDVETLLRAAALVHEALPEVRFRLFGSAPPGNEAYLQDCLDLRRRLGLEQSVAFEGFEPRAAAAFGEADVVVLSSISEGFPYSTLEAMLCGKPLVATAVGGVPEQVSPACGRTVRPRDHQALAQAILDLVEDADTRAALGRAARERAESLFGLERFRATQRAMYEQLADAATPNGRAPGEDRPHTPAATTRNGSPRLTRPAAERRKALVRTICGRVPRPVDPLEIATVIESLGVTDAVAREDYGADSAFELAERLFERMRARSEPPGDLRRAPPDEEPEATEPQRRLLDLAPLAAASLYSLLPLALLVAAISAMAQAGLDSGRILAVSLGMSAGMLLANGFVQAIGHRTSIYVGFGYRRMARRFLTAGALAGLAAVAALDLAALLIASAAEVATEGERRTFALALVTFSALWLLAGGVAVTRRGGRAAGRSEPSARTGRIGLPPAPYALLESAPYFAYGLIFMAFLFEAHVLGWLGRPEAGLDRLDGIGAFEIGLTAALLPVILATGIAERVSRRLWPWAKEQQRLVPAGDAARFGRALAGFHRRHLSVYAAVTAGLSGVTLVAFEVTLHTGVLGEWVELTSPDTTELAFAVGLAAFWLVGCGQLSAAFALGLGRPGHAARGAVAAIAVVTVTGVPLSLAGFRYAVIAFALGAAAFALVSLYESRRVLAEADYHYSAAL